MEIKWSEVAHAQIPVLRQPLGPRYRRLLGFGGDTDVDDDGDAIGKREICAEFPFYDVEILHHQKGPNPGNALTIDSGASLGCRRWPSGPAV
jgi:hypothetical protein